MRGLLLCLIAIHSGLAYKISENEPSNLIDRLPEEDIVQDDDFIDEVADDLELSEEEVLAMDKGRAIEFFSDNRRLAERQQASPCCHKLRLDAVQKHGIWMIHFNKLTAYTITNTLINGRNTWVNDQDPDLIISWCGTFWHVGHREQAGECNGYISSPNDALCFEQVRDMRYYVHCINEWVDAGPSNLRVTCMDGGRRSGKISSNQNYEKKIDPRTVDTDIEAEEDEMDSELETNRNLLEVQGPSL